MYDLADELELRLGRAVVVRVFEELLFDRNGLIGDTLDVAYSQVPSGFKITFSPSSVVAYRVCA